MRFLAFTALGMLLGYLYFAWVRRATGPASSHGAALERRSLPGMLVRLVAFALVLGFLLYRFGPLAGVAALVGMAASRGLMARAELRPPGH